MKDDLRPARGIINGAIFSTIGWIIFLILAWWLFR